jgi:WXG100 family type VII secretion target
MATYSVDIATLEDAQFDLRAIYSNLESALLRLERAYTEYQAANAGQAVEGYQDAQSKWNTQMGQFHEALNKAGVAVGEIGANYQHVDLRGKLLFQP